MSEIRTLSDQARWVVKMGRDLSITCLLYMFIEEINITSRPSVVYRIVVLKNSRNPKKILVSGTLSNKVTNLQPATLFKERH